MAGNERAAYERVYAASTLLRAFSHTSPRRHLPARILNYSRLFAGVDSIAEFSSLPNVDCADSGNDEEGEEEERGEGGWAEKQDEGNRLRSK